MNYNQVTLLIAFFHSVPTWAKVPSKQKRPHFKIGIYEMLKNASGAIVGFEGAIVDITEWLAKRLDFSYTIVPLMDYKSEKLPNGTWIGNIPLLLNTEVNYLFNGAHLNPEYNKIIDYITNINEEPQVLLVPPPQEESRLLAPFKPFSLTVWLGLIASMMVLAFSTYYIFVLEKGIRLPASSRSHQPNLAEITMGLSRVLLGQGGLSELVYASLSKRFAACFWCLAAIILVNGYTSCFISFATTPKHFVSANNVEELAFKSNLDFLVVGTNRLQYYYNSTSPAYTALGEQLKQRSKNILPRNRFLMERISTGCCATIHIKYFLEYLLLLDYEKTKQCRAAITTSPQGWEFFAFLAQKGDPLVKNMSHEVLWMKAQGLMQHSFRNKMKVPWKCLKPVPPNIRPLKLIDLSSAFVLLLIGILLSFLVFAGEVMAGVMKKRTVQNNLVG